MDIKIEEEGDFYNVFVKVPKYNRSYGKRKFIIETDQVRKKVESMGHEIAETIQTDYIHNINGSTRGTWIFKKKFEKPLDKPVEKVILTKEKTPAPKKRKSRAKKKTTK
jgi:hypoxanthine-guanine phosphoribosyltransferase